jgi:hypothetical protein
MSVFATVVFALGFLAVLIQIVIGLMRKLLDGDWF